MGGERLWDAPWPVADPEMLVSDTVVYAVQVNGKLRGEVGCRPMRRRRTCWRRPGPCPNVAAHLDGKTVAKEIFVPGRLVNLVAR